MNGYLFSVYFHSTSDNVVKFGAEKRSGEMKSWDSDDQIAIYTRQRYGHNRIIKSVDSYGRLQRNDAKLRNMVRIILVPGWS